MVATPLNPKISAIVSIYNAREFLAGRLFNLLCQDNAHELEIVCVLCGSRHPEDYRIVYEAAERAPNITIIEKPRIPLYAAWNVGIEAASGEYICNANCDDRLAPWALRKLADVLDKGADVVYSSWWCTVTPNALWDGDWQLYLGDPIYYPQGRVMWGHQPFSYTRLAEQCFLGPGPLWKKTLWEKVGGFDETFGICADYEMWCKFALAGAKIQPLPLYAGIFYHNDSQVSRLDANQMTFENWRIRHKYMEALKEYEG